MLSIFGKEFLAFTVSKRISNTVDSFCRGNAAVLVRGLQRDKQKGAAQWRGVQPLVSLVNKLIKMGIRSASKTHQEKAKNLFVPQRISKFYVWMQDQRRATAGVQSWKRATTVVPALKKYTRTVQHWTRAIIAMQCRTNTFVRQGSNPSRRVEDWDVEILHQS